LGVDRLAKIPQSRDGSLEAVDFIVNVLQEHEKDLDKLVNELARVFKQIGETATLSAKVEKVEGKIDNLQKEVAYLISHLSGSAPKGGLPAAVKERVVEAAQTAPSGVVQGGFLVILRCKQWEDFQTFALQAQMLFFSYEENERSFKIDALKNNQIISFSGALPKFSTILKTWLSEKLDVPEKNILEGVLTTS